MKKLIIASIVLAFAATTQAANWKWGMSNVFDGTGSTATTAKYSGTAYLFDSASYSQSAIYALLCAGESVSSKAIASTSVVDGLVNLNLASSTFSYGSDGVAKAYNFYAVIIESDMAYFSNVKAATSLTTSTAQSIQLGTQNNSSTTFSSVAPTGKTFAGEGRWSVTSVPEPTSGLLVMLGVGLMALRRRRA